MLVLSRKVGERVMIGDNVVIYIASITQGRVKVGVEAPKDMLVLRGELVPQKPPEKAE